MPSSKSIPSPPSITYPQFTHLLSLYPSTLQRVYEHKIKDATKRAQALADDAWRYGELVDVLAERRRRGGKKKKKSGPSDSNSGGGLSGGWLEKAEVERLVRWKMYVAIYSLNQFCISCFIIITSHFQFSFRFDSFQVIALVDYCVCFVDPTTGLPNRQHAGEKGVLA